MEFSRVLSDLLLFVILLLLTLFNIWFERRVVGRMQHRPGPNVNGPFGLLQSLAHALKLIFTEDIITKTADRAVYQIGRASCRDSVGQSFEISVVDGTLNNTKNTNTT